MGGGGQKQTCLITGAIKGPRTHHAPPQVPRESPMTLCSPFLKFCSICAEKEYSAQKKKSEHFVSAEYLLAQNIFFMRIIF